MSESINLRAVNKEDIAQIKNRDPKYLEADKSFIKTLAQAAVNVELFTIPLYMTSMYSLVGVHQINTKDTDFYKGRWWPGLAPSFAPNLPDVIDIAGEYTIANKKAFNNIFSVFMEEMLHLQLASNIASKIGVKPSFTSPALQDEKNGWICYGINGKPSKVIPHIIDLNDCKEPYSNINVELGALNTNQINLFLAIEETLEVAVKKLKDTPEVINKYAHKAPYNDWKPTNTENDLPLFATIGKMYETLWAYIEIRYSDGTTLLGELSKAVDTSYQRDRFNMQTSSHPMREFPDIAATLGDYSSEEILKIELLNIINAITDQGEGAGVVKIILEMWDIEKTLEKHLTTKIKPSSHHHGHHHKNAPMLNAVKPQFQPDKEALKADYKGYNDEGSETEISGQARARIDDAPFDHYETFSKVKEIMEKDGVYTWDEWHAKGNRWTKELLQEGETNSNYNIPTAKEVANALNELKDNEEKEGYYKLLTLGAVGTLKGVTTSLNSYWNTECGEFPNPAMTGSGDRISICWATLGKYPDLSMGIDSIDTNVEMFNACQGMSLMDGKVGQDEMPDVRIYHSCKGSNECKTQGGCGYVQNANGGGQCGSSTQTGSDTLMSAPANNKCGAKGGCAVPISASQLFPESGKMQIYTYQGKEPFTTKEIEVMPYDKGEAVYDVAWKAYTKALEARKESAPEKPKVNPLRVAFPPST